MQCPQCATALLASFKFCPECGCTLLLAPQNVPASRQRTAAPQEEAKGEGCHEQQVNNNATQGKH